MRACCSRAQAEPHVRARQEHGQLFRRLLDKSQGQRSAWEYPFAAAGVNLAFMLQASNLLPVSVGCGPCTGRWQRCQRPRCDSCAAQEVLDLRDKRTSALQPAGHTPCGSAAAGFLGLLEAEAPAFPEVDPCACDRAAGCGYLAWV